jgi:ATP-dependent protease ClpP protease subunit
MKANENLEELLMMPQEQKGLIRTITQQMHTHLVFIDDDITDPRNYRDVIHCLATCSENDSVNLLVNSSGGRTDSIWQIIEAMKGCRGDSAEFMLHTAHYGSIGTVPNVKGQTEFATRQINKLLDQAYKGFLTDKELDELKNGKEFWFDAEESGKRMTKRYKYLNGLNKPPKPVKVKEVTVE